VEFQRVVDFIHSNGSFIITAHETPDGDAIGSEIAAYHALRGLGKTAVVLNADPTPKKFAFLDADAVIRVLSEDPSIPDGLEKYSLLILDTNDVHNIGAISSLVLPHVKEYFIIDHHESEVAASPGNFIRKEASSTSEILYQLFQEMKLDIGFPMAQALFAAIVFDTGSFIYPKTTALTFDIARDLVSRGVEPNLVYSRLYESNSISALVLQSRVLATLELAFEDRVSILTMTRQMIIDSGAIYEEADQVINIPLRSEQVRVSVFFKENTEGLLRCSLRSKGNINVSDIARSFGGGGHKTAAGFKCRDGLARTKQAVLEALRPQLS
jgi:bifunctional oligoribonuclease and PAP phosphatase NrnA